MLVLWNPITIALALLLLAFMVGMAYLAVDEPASTRSEE